MLGNVPRHRSVMLRRARPARKSLHSNTVARWLSQPDLKDIERLRSLHRCCSVRVSTCWHCLNRLMATVGARALGHATLSIRLLMGAPLKSIVRSKAASRYLRTALEVPSGPHPTLASCSIAGIHVETIASTQRSTACLVRSHTPRNPYSHQQSSLSNSAPHHY
jgi:hypothetical protein